MRDSRHKKRHWVLSLVGLLSVGFLGTAGYLIWTYASSLDWSRSHSSRLAGLPVYAVGNPAGEYRLQVENLVFRLQTAGDPNSRECVILLHGFPESSQIWKPLLDAVPDSHFRFLAFDQRGYSPGARPPAVDDYSLDALSADVLHVIEASHCTAVHLVGHDWGALVGWQTVLTNPGEFRSWTGMAIPHPAVFFDAVLHNPEQAKRSQYLARLQQRWLPEYGFSRKNFARFKALVSDQDQRFTDDYLAIVREPGAMTSILAWYRALDVQTAASRYNAIATTTVPTLFISGREDPLVIANLFRKQEQHLQGGYKHIEVDSGHAIMQTRPRPTIAAILEHIDSHRGVAIPDHKL